MELFVQILIEMDENVLKLIQIYQSVPIKLLFDVVLIDKPILIGITLTRKFIFNILQSIMQCDFNISWITCKYIKLCFIIIKFTCKLIKCGKITTNSIEIMPNSCKMIDILTSYNDNLFFKIFSTSNVVTMVIWWFSLVLMDCKLDMVLFGLIRQFTIKMDDKLLITSIFKAIYAITTIIFNVVTVAVKEIFHVIFFQLVLNFLKQQLNSNNNSNDRQLKMIEFAVFWQLGCNFNCMIVNSAQIESNLSNKNKNLIDMSNIKNKNKNTFCKKSDLQKNFRIMFSSYLFWIILIILMIGCIIMQLLMHLIHKLIVILQYKLKL